MTMLETAITHMQPNCIYSLSELRKASGIALRSQYRLAEQLRHDDRVMHCGSNQFALKAN